MNKKMITIPNLITCSRILVSIGLFFLEPLSLGFFILYTYCGISDVLDGAVARAMKCTSEFGAKLDSVSDLVFYTMMILKILPLLFQVLPLVFWIIICVVFAIRGMAYLVAAVKFRKFAAVHTILNKMTSVCVFSVPYLIRWKYAVPVCLTYAGIAMAASTEELWIHVNRKEYRTGIKSILQKNWKE